jgi:hypothetical protein
VRIKTIIYVQYLAPPGVENIGDGRRAVACERCQHLVSCNYRIRVIYSVMHCQDGQDGQPLSSSSGSGALKPPEPSLRDGAHFKFCEGKGRFSLHSWYGGVGFARVGAQKKTKKTAKTVGWQNNGGFKVGMVYIGRCRPQSKR